ncbi:hypothetical protein [Fructobacillus ficulneus]|uniref:Uncharacterized protein n=1 Tax=Fructobacillus ficulneus TaxID=157463 RepID=A0A0K8MGG1_9LACO|nr:hypothetical protein [Fructobacillus ficulneus]GAO99293.1 hypothetical protein FFIC_091200 [Fructobacillus ficulneus]
MELWNIFSTVVTVGVIAFGAHLIGYDIGQQDAHEHNTKAKA